MRPSRRACPPRSGRTTRSPHRAAQPSLNTTHTNTASSRPVSASSGGTSYGIRATRILALARTSRCAMVDAGTRKARAISSVDRPPSVRSVSATCASVASAGWQHVKIRRSLSSGTGASSSAVDSAMCRAISASFRARRVRRRRRSMALCRAVPISQATGFAGRPAAGHCSSAAANASCSASSATSMSPSTRISVARIRPYSVRKISSMRIVARWAGYPTGRLRARHRLFREVHLHDGPNLDRAAHPHRRDPRREDDGLVEVLRLHDEVATELLLRLGERAVRRDRLTVLAPHGGRRAGRLQRIARQEGTLLTDVVDELAVLLVDGAPLRLGHLGHLGLLVVDQQHVAHGRLSFHPLVERGRSNRHHLRRLHACAQPGGGRAPKLTDLYARRRYRGE